MNSLFYNNISIIMPKITPVKYISDTISKFSFIFLFVLNSNNIPNPLPGSNPAIKWPIVINFDKYNSVIITLLAQFGINPIRLAIKYVNIFLCRSIFDKLFSPILNISMFINRLAINIKIKIFIWRMVLLKMV